MAARQDIYSNQHHESRSHGVAPFSPQPPEPAGNTVLSVILLVFGTTPEGRTPDLLPNLRESSTNSEFVFDSQLLEKILLYASVLLALTGELSEPLEGNSPGRVFTELEQKGEALPGETPGIPLEDQESFLQVLEHPESLHLTWAPPISLRFPLLCGPAKRKETRRKLYQFSEEKRFLPRTLARVRGLSFTPAPQARHQQHLLQPTPS